MTNKKEAVATEVIGLDGKKTVFKNNTSSEDESKSVKPVRRTRKITENEKEEKKSTKKTKSSKDDKVVEKEKKTTTKKSSTKKKVEQDFKELIEKLSAELIENLGKVFVRIDDCERIVIQTIQKLAIGGIQEHIEETEAKLDKQLDALNSDDRKAESTDPS